MQTTTEVSFVQDDHVVEEFAADRSDHALGERVLPGRTGRRKNFGDAHATNPSPKLAAAVDAVAIAEEVTRRRVIRKRLDDLLRGPGGSRGIGHVEVHDLAAMMQQDHENVQHSKGRGRYDEEADGDEVGEVVLKERAPGLRGWRWATRHEPGNGAPRDVEPELE